MLASPYFFPGARMLHSSAYFTGKEAAARPVALPLQRIQKMAGLLA